MIWTSLIAQGKRRLWMSLFVATMLALVYFHFWRFYQGRVSGWILFVGWVPVAANLLRAGLGLVYFLDRHPFRAVDLGLESDQVSPGGSFVVEIRAVARRPVVIRKLAAALRCTRQGAAASGGRDSMLHDEERVLERNFPATSGGGKTYRVSLPVPATAPFSFRSMESRIVWEIDVVADVEGWGEIRDAIEVTVAPG